MITHDAPIYNEHSCGLAERIRPRVSSCEGA